MTEIGTHGVVIEPELAAMQHRVDGAGGGIAGHQGVAVGRRLAERLEGEETVAPGPVLDRDRLAENALHLLGDRTGDDVGRAPRRIGDQKIVMGRFG